VSMTSVRQNLAAKFTDKAYRDAFVAEQIFSRLPMKMRCIREAQDLTQRQLGDLAGMKQTWVSKLEDPNYGKLTIATILKVASALDVGVQIDFVPYSKVLSDAVYRTSGSFVVPKFADDPGIAGMSGAFSGIVQGTQSHQAMGTLITFPENVGIATSGTAPRNITAVTSSETTTLALVAGL
jgi:transcriptional regulator with XRE-family HTH domain